MQVERVDHNALDCVKPLNLSTTFPRSLQSMRGLHLCVFASAFSYFTAVVVGAGVDPAARFSNWARR